MFKKWKLRILWGLAGGLLLLALLLLARTGAIRVEVQRVDRGVVLSTLQADGVFRARDREEVTAFADGDLSRVEWEVGDEVKKGQVLFTLFWDMKTRPVRAPMRGVVSQVFRKSSGPVRRGDRILEIVDPDNLEIRVELLTTDAMKLKPGDPARVTGWTREIDESIASPEFPVTLVRVSRAGFVKPSALGVEEERTDAFFAPHFPASHPKPEYLTRMGDDFHASLDIEVARVESVLRVPLGALVRNGEGWSVFRVEAGRAVLTSVTIGLRGDEFAEVKSGVSEGQPVLVYPGDEIADGVRIEERDS